MTRKTPQWLEGGASTPTVLATLLSLFAAPLGGLGVLAILFGAWVPGVLLMVAAVASWISGRRLLDR